MIDTYRAASLHLANLGNAVVVVDDLTPPGKIVVSVIGSAESEQAVTVRVDGDELHVSGPYNTGTVVTSGGGVNIVSGNASVGTMVGQISGGMVQIGSSGIVIAGGTGEVIVNGRRINLDDIPQAPAPARVKVTVRTGTPVTITDTTIGNYRIGSTRGPLTVSGSMTTVEGGSVGATRLRVKGNGDVRIDEVTGPRLAVTVSGTGSVVVKGGQVEEMTARVSGTGGVAFNGTVNGPAELEVSGVGGIAVHRVTGPIDRYTSGIGRITVRHR
ncbi:hypothetical protein Cme02nite_26120 [Catellatospora methionotrophica]|uniref:Putative auto-transporter adhesin head GIN domain-containing protein n=1 Tax=Catellatospora methionotrophica TaxID=121620 RepID=A0A8J3LKB2_9ACTN|nr:DUF2807 domain-containing protein [Catellatospora methionotrophica]GIG14280.1 hypothetical protein Cme02nite_26120 [Catellatospora methionotrophica]